MVAVAVGCRIRRPVTWKRESLVTVVLAVTTCTIPAKSLDSTNLQKSRYIKVKKVTLRTEDDCSGVVNGKILRRPKCALDDESAMKQSHDWEI